MPRDVGQTPREKNKGPSGREERWSDLTNISEGPDFHLGMTVNE